MYYGANSSMTWNPDIRRVAEPVFNALNVLTYAGHLCPERLDVFNPNVVGDIQRQMREFGGKYLTGHPLIYNLNGTLPEELPTGAEMEQYFADYKRMFPQLTTVDVVNEPIHNRLSLPTDFERFSTKAREMGFIRRVNEYGWTDAVIRAGLRGLMKHGDIVGLQAHLYGVTYSRPAITGLISSVRKSLADIATWGHPIHITEVSVPSAGNGWTATRQADVLVKLYETFRMFPQVSLISYWDLCDAGAWNPMSGLFDASGRPKSAWYSVSKFIKANP